MPVFRSVDGLATPEVAALARKEACDRRRVALSLCAGYTLPPATSSTACANSRGASCGRLWPTPPVITR